jgi:anti-sigma-K factor RskA
MSDNLLPDDNDPDLLIAEYVLGVLTREQREQVQAMAAQNPRYQASIAAWQQHFDTWLEQIPPAETPAGAWPAIERQLFPTAPAEPGKPRSGWNDIRLWRWTAAALCAALLVATFALLQPPSPATPALLARLEQNDGNTLFAATVMADGRAVLFVPTRNHDWQGKSAQAWLIGADGKPHSLGLLPANNAVSLDVPPGLSEALIGGAVLAVSLEPPNGSPTGLPTGPVVAQGKISSL